MFEITVVDEPSVFEPLKFYCIVHSRDLKHWYLKVSYIKEYILDTFPVFIYISSSVISNNIISK